MTDKHKEDATTIAYFRGFECGQDAAKARIAELEAALNNILSCHRNAMMDPRLFSALIPDFVLEEAFGVLKKEWVKEQPDAARAALEKMG